MDSKKTREISTALKHILSIDMYMTNVFVQTAEKFLFLRQLRIHAQALEISCHGVAWIASWIAFMFLVSTPNLHQMQVNFFFGLLLDICFVAIIKALVRRRRPEKNTDILSVGPDKYSFPSGHASRAALIVYFFINLWTVPLICVPPLFAWATSICISRILKKRHYLLDIAGGIVLGIFEGILISLFYLETETCTGLINWMTDEKLEGGEYHV